MFLYIKFKIIYLEKRQLNIYINRKLQNNVLFFNIFHTNYLIVIYFLKSSYLILFSEVVFIKKQFD